MFTTYVERHEWRGKEVAILGLEKGGDRFANRNDKGTHVQYANDTSGKPLLYTNFGLQFRSGNLGSHPSSRRMGNQEHFLPLIYQRLQDFEHGLGVFLALGVSPSRRRTVEIWLADVANIQLGKVSCGELWAVSINAFGFEGVEKWLIGCWGMV
jgi:hypothetical protein